MDCEWWVLRDSVFDKLKLKSRVGLVLFAGEGRVGGGVSLADCRLTTGE